MLKRAEGVVSADASFISGQAVVTYDSGRTSPEQLVAAINNGTFYRASVAEEPGDGHPERRTITFTFERQFDPRRTWQIGTRLRELQGVTDVNALEDGRVSIAFDPERVDPKRILAVIEEMGYAVARAEGVPPSVSGSSGRAWSLTYGLLAGLLLLSAVVLVYRRRYRKSAWPGDRR